MVLGYWKAGDRNLARTLNALVFLNLTGSPPATDSNGKSQLVLKWRSGKVDENQEIAVL